MKTKLFKTFSLLLSIALLIVMSSFIASASDLPGLEAVGTSVELDGTKDVEVTVGIECTEDLTVYGIEGVWEEDSEYLTLTKLGSDKLTFNGSNTKYADVPTGKVLWTDITFSGSGAMAKGQKLLTATFKVAAGTPADEYTVRFVCDVFTGSDAKPDETDHVFEATIKVIHKCSNGIKQNGQAPTCTVAGWQDYYKCSKCNKYYTDAACTNEISNLTTWKNGDGKIPATDHDWTTNDPTYTNNGDDHTAKYVCGNDAIHTKEETEEHEYIDGECVCGAKEPVTGLKGDVDLDGDVDMDDVIALLCHVMKVDGEMISDPNILALGEVTGDTTLDMDDVIKILQYVMKAGVDSLD